MSQQMSTRQSILLSRETGVDARDVAITYDQAYALVGRALNGEAAAVREQLANMGGVVKYDLPDANAPTFRQAMFVRRTLRLDLRPSSVSRDQLTEMIGQLKEDDADTDAISRKLLAAGAIEVE